MSKINSKYLPSPPKNPKRLKLCPPGPEGLASPNRVVDYKKMLFAGELNVWIGVAASASESIFCYNIILS